MNLLPSSSAFHGFDGWSAVQAERADKGFEPPQNAEDFARHVIFVICHASVTASVGRRTYEHCVRALEFGATARTSFRHPGKAEAIDRIWHERERFFRTYRESNDKLGYLASLPWIGPVTKRNLARRLGLLADQRAAA